MTTPPVIADSLTSIWRFIYKFCPFDCTTIAGRGKVGPLKLSLTASVGWMLSYDCIRSLPFSLFILSGEDFTFVSVWRITVFASLRIKRLHYYNVPRYHWLVHKNPLALKEILTGNAVGISSKSHWRWQTPNRCRFLPWITNPTTLASEPASRRKVKACPQCRNTQTHNFTDFKILTVLTYHLHIIPSPVTFFLHDYNGLEFS